MNMIQGIQTVTTSIDCSHCFSSFAVLSNITVYFSIVFHKAWAVQGFLKWPEQSIGKVMCLT